jgi:hypothetical protein
MVSGGEIFLYSLWKEPVDELMKYGYKPPLFSTKVPIKKTANLLTIIPSMYGRHLKPE